jgi:hypothetical protein
VSRGTESTPLLDCDAGLQNTSVMNLTLQVGTPGTSIPSKSFILTMPQLQKRILFRLHPLAIFFISSYRSFIPLGRFNHLFPFTHLAWVAPEIFVLLARENRVTHGAYGPKV